jgi:hypothetical protein
MPGLDRITRNTGGVLRSCGNRSRLRRNTDRRAMRTHQGRTDPLHLALAQPQMLGRFPHRDPPRHRILNYLDSLQFRLAQCHPLLSTPGDKVPEQLKSDKIAEQLQESTLGLTPVTCA